MARRRQSQELLDQLQDAREESKQMKDKFQALKLDNHNLREKLHGLEEVIRNTPSSTPRQGGNDEDKFQMMKLDNHNLREKLHDLEEVIRNTPSNTPRAGGTDQESDLTEQKDALTAETSQLRAELQATRFRVEELESENRRSQSSDAEIGKLGYRVQQLESEGLEAELDNLRAELRSSECVIDKVEQCETQADDEATWLRSEVQLAGSSHAMQRVELREELKQAQEQARNSQEKFISLKHDNHRLKELHHKAEVESAEMQNSSSSTAPNETKSQLTALIAGQQQLEQENSRLRGLLFSYEQSAQNNEIEAARSSAKTHTQVAELHAELRSRNEEMQALRNESAHAEHVARLREARVDELDAMHKVKSVASTRQVQEVELRLAEMQKKVNDLEAYRKPEEATSVRKIQELEAKLAEMVAYRKPEDTASARRIQELELKFAEMVKKASDYCEAQQSSERRAQQLEEELQQSEAKLERELAKQESLVQHEESVVARQKLQVQELNANLQSQGRDASSVQDVEARYKEELEAVKKQAAGAQEEMSHRFASTSRMLSTALQQVESLRASKEALIRESQKSVQTESNLQVSMELRAAQERLQFSQAQSTAAMTENAARMQNLERKMEALSEDNWILEEKYEMQRDESNAAQPRNKPISPRISSGRQPLQTERGVTPPTRQSPNQTNGTSRSSVPASQVRDDSSVSQGLVRLTPASSSKTAMGLQESTSLRRIFANVSDKKTEEHKVTMEQQSSLPIHVVRLSFDAPFAGIDHEQFTAELFRAFASLGIQESFLQRMLVMLRSGSVIAEVHGPFDVIQQLRAKPLSTLSVMGFAVKGVESSRSFSPRRSERSVSAPKNRVTPAPRIARTASSSALLSPSGPPPKNLTSYPCTVNGVPRLAISSRGNEQSPALQRSRGLSGNERRSSSRRAGSSSPPSRQPVVVQPPWSARGPTSPSNHAWTPRIVPASEITSDKSSNRSNSTRLSASPDRRVSPPLRGPQVNHSPKTSTRVVSGTSTAASSIPSPTSANLGQPVTIGQGQTDFRWKPPPTSPRSVASVTPRSLPTSLANEAQASWRRPTAATTTAVSTAPRHVPSDEVQASWRTPTATATVASASSHVPHSSLSRMGAAVQVATKR